MENRKKINYLSPPVLADTRGGQPGSPAGNLGYMDPNLPPIGIQPSPLWMGDVTQ